MEAGGSLSNSKSGFPVEKCPLWEKQARAAFHEASPSAELVHCSGVGKQDVFIALIRRIHCFLSHAIVQRSQTTWLTAPNNFLLLQGKA